MLLIAIDLYFNRDITVNLQRIFMIYQLLCVYNVVGIQVFFKIMYIYTPINGRAEVLKIYLISKIVLTKFKKGQCYR